MRLENHDFEVLLPQVLSLLSKNSSIKVQHMNYQFSKNKMYLSAKGSYGGLAISIELVFSCFVKAGALGINIEQSYLDSILMKGDILPYLKTMIKNNRYFCLEDRIIYFYHPKMMIESLAVDDSGIELTFK